MSKIGSEMSECTRNCCAECMKYVKKNGLQLGDDANDYIRAAYCHEVVLVMIVVVQNL